MQGNGKKILRYLAGAVLGAGAFGAIFLTWSISTQEAFDVILWTPLGAIKGITIAVAILILREARKRGKLATWEWILLYHAGAVLGALSLGSPAMLVTTRSSWWVDLTDSAYGDWVVAIPGAALIGAIAGVVSAYFVRKRLIQKAKQQTADQEPIPLAELGTEAPVDVIRSETSDQSSLAELEPETLRYIIRHGFGAERRRQALAELEKRETVGRPEGDNDG